MKFAIALTLATTAMAGIVARDSDVPEIIATAGKDIDALKAAAKAYNGDKTELVKAADTLVSDLKEGKKKVDAGPMLDAADTLKLTGPVGDLTESGTQLTDTLTERKPEVEKAGECKTVQDQIAAISTNSQALIKAVIAKVPKEAQSIAQGLADKLTAVLEKAEESYKDCTNSGGNGGSSTGSSTGTTEPTSTGSSTGMSTPTGTATGTSAPATTDCSTTGHSATGTGVLPTTTSSQVTVPTGAAALYAPAGALAAVAAALAL